MESKLKQLLSELRSENEARSKQLSVNFSEAKRISLINAYNNTLDIIKRIESILK